MTLDEAIKKVEHYWHTGMDDYFTYDEILELEEMLKELKYRRELDKSVCDRLRAELFDYNNGFLITNYEAGYDDGIKKAIDILKGASDSDGKG
jgi:hypothetical protein